MKAVFCALFALTTFAGTVAAADKPNFSGDWKMNAAKSNFGPIPGPASIVRKVTHAEPSLSIVEEQQGDQGTQVTTRKYTTDGKDMTFESSGAVVRGTAVWEGNTLILTSVVDAIGVPDLDLVVVFDKQ